MAVPTADQERLSHILADDLQVRIQWAYDLEQEIATLSGGGLTSWGLASQATYVYAGDPNGNVTAVALGDFLIDTQTPALWLADGPGTAWTQASGGGGGGAVSSVNSQTGAVVLTYTDVGADAAGAAAAAQSASQPVDSDLTAIAALTTTSFGRAFLTLADAAAGISALGLDADLATLALPASTTISTFGASLIDDAAASNARTTLGLGTAAVAASTDFDASGAAAAAQAASQPLDSDLTAIAALTTTSFGRGLLALADAAAGRTALGLGTASLLADPITAAHGGTGLTTLTAHALQVGNGTGTVTQVGPDASSAKALFAAGSSADPAFRAVAESDVTNLTADLAAKAPIASPTFTGTVTLPADPTVGLQAATKQYVDNAVISLDSQAPVAYASTAALPANTYSNGTSGVGATLTGNSNGPLIIDGVTILIGQVGERVLVGGESTGSHNGIYTITQQGVIAVSPYILTRATDYDQSAEIDAGDLFAVEAPGGFTPGSANNQKVFLVAAPPSFTVGTDTMTFALVGGTYAAGTGLGLSGTTFSIDTAVTVDKTTAQTLTNKTLTSPAITTPTGIVATDIASGIFAIGRIPTGTDGTHVPLGGVITGAGPTGDASHTLALTYNAAGQLTAVTNNAIAIAESQVTNLTTDLAAKQLGLIPTAVKTATTYAAAAQDFVPCDTTSNAITVTLPTAPADRTLVGIKHVIQGGTNSVTFACGGSDVINKAGGVTSGTLPVLSESVILQYKSSGAIWYVVEHDSPRTAQYFDALAALAPASLAAITTQTAIQAAQIAALLAAQNGYYVGQGLDYFPSATTGKLDRHAGIAQFGSVEASGTAATAIGSTVATLGTALTSGQAMWVNVELDNTAASQFNSGSAAAAALAPIPATTSGRTVVGWIYIPQGATVIDTALTTTNGNAKFYDARVVRTAAWPKSWPFVESGCVWTGDALASTKAASMTAGWVNIGGVRLYVAAVTARTFTASKDTYVDLQNNGDGTASITYTEVSNNAASPALPNSGTVLNTIRNAIVITGASNIASATLTDGSVGAINQGSLFSVLPIASSQAYSVADSLGNPIYNTSKDIKRLSARQLIATYTTTATSTTDITGLHSIPFIIPAGMPLRPVKVSFFAAAVSSSAVAGTSIFITLKNGATSLAEQLFSVPVVSYYVAANVVYNALLAPGSYNFKLTSTQAAAGTFTIPAGAADQIIVTVELL